MKKLFRIAAVVMLCIGCGGPQVKLMKYTADTYPATLPTNVEVLRTKIEARSYVEIGEVSLRVNKSNEETAIGQLKERAAQIGADAIILVGERTAGVVGSSAVAIPLREIYGIAIKYK